MYSAHVKDLKRPRFGEVSLVQIRQLLVNRGPDGALSVMRTYDVRSYGQLKLRGCGGEVWLDKNL